MRSPKRPARNPCEVHGNDGTTQHTLLKAAGLHRARAHLGRAARRLLSYALLTPRAVAARPASSLPLGEFRLSCHEHLQQTFAIPACTAKKRPFPVWPPASLPASPPVYIQVPIQAPKQGPGGALGAILAPSFRAPARVTFRNALCPRPQIFSALRYRLLHLADCGHPGRFRGGAARLQGFSAGVSFRQRCSRTRFGPPREQKTAAKIDMQRIHGT